jgi:hypothetical protein
MTPGLRGVLLLLDALSLVVPACRRRAWREQWRAELWHYAISLTRDGRGMASPTFFLSTCTCRS